MLNLHNEAASLCDRVEWGTETGGVTLKVWWGICCHPKDTSGMETVFPSMSRNGAHKATAVTNPWEGARPEPGWPPASVWWGDTPTDAHVHPSFTCLTVDTPVCISTIEMTSSVNSFCGRRGINREEERRQHSLCTLCSLAYWSL